MIFGCLIPCLLVWVSFLLRYSIADLKNSFILHLSRGDYRVVQRIDTQPDTPSTMRELVGLFPRRTLWLHSGGAARTTTTEKGSRRTGKEKRRQGG